MPIDPLQPRIPIVDAQGRPTPQFMQQWERLRALVADVADVEGTYGGSGVDITLTVDGRGKITQISDV